MINFKYSIDSRELEERGGSIDIQELLVTCMSTHFQTDEKFADTKLNSDQPYSTHFPSVPIQNGQPSTQKAEKSSHTFKVSATSTRLWTRSNSIRT